MRNKKLARRRPPGYIPDVSRDATQSDYQRQFDEDEDEQPPEPDSPLKPYGLNETVPFRKKVERLHVAHRLTTEEIAVILECTENDVDGIISVLHEEWSRLGTERTEEEKKRERGRAIADLEVMLSQLEEQYLKWPESQTLNMKLKVRDELSELMKLNAKEEIETSESLDLQSVLSEKIAGLSAAQLSSLRDRLAR